MSKQFNYVRFLRFHLPVPWLGLPNYFSNFQHSDMMEEMKGEVMELVVTACEKHSTNNEVS
jgi:hypothetical protein